MGITEPEVPRGLWGLSAPGQAFAGPHNFAKCSYLNLCIQVVQVLSMSKVDQHLADFFTSCASQGGHPNARAKAWSYKHWKAITHIHVRRGSISAVLSFKVSI